MNLGDIFGGVGDTIDNAVSGVATAVAGKGGILDGLFREVDNLIFEPIEDATGINWETIAIGAAIYFGGGMAGWWETPFTSAAAAGETAATTQALGAPVAPTPAAAPLTEAAAAPVTPTSTAAPLTEVTTATEAAIPQVPATPEALTADMAAKTTTPTVAAPSATSSDIVGALTSTPKTEPGLLTQASNWANKNPFLASMALQTGGSVLSAMTTPTQAEQMQEMAEWKRRNSNIAGVGYDGSGNNLNVSLRRAAMAPKV